MALVNIQEITEWESRKVISRCIRIYCRWTGEESKQNPGNFIYSAATYNSSAVVVPGCVELPNDITLDNAHVIADDIRSTMETHLKKILQVKLVTALNNAVIKARNNSDRGRIQSGDWRLREQVVNKYQDNPAVLRGLMLELD